MKVVSIIRDRGQLTIPDPIRRLVSWASPMSAISISVLKPDEIIIKPHQAQVEWDQIWENIKKSRAIESKSKISSAEFLEQDRSGH